MNLPFSVVLPERQEESQGQPQTEEPSAELGVVWGRYHVERGFED